MLYVFVCYLFSIPLSIFTSLLIFLLLMPPRFLSFALPSPCMENPEELCFSYTANRHEISGWHMPPQVIQVRQHVRIQTGPSITNRPGISLSKTARAQSNGWPSKYWDCWQEEKEIGKIFHALHPGYNGAQKDLQINFISFKQIQNPCVIRFTLSGQKTSGVMQLEPAEEFLNCRMLSAARLQPTAFSNRLEGAWIQRGVKLHTHKWGKEMFLAWSK